MQLPRPPYVGRGLHTGGDDLITANTHGAPNWVDLATSDIDAATRFYRDLFDWTIEKTTSPMGDYFIGKADDQQVGGMMEVDPGLAETPPMWTTFFNVDNVDDMAVKVEATGGSVLQDPFDIPEARIAIVADPTGAMFGLFGGPEIEGVWMTRQNGGVCWVETMTRDPAASESFYAAVFDWKAETQISEGMAYTTFLLDDEPVAGMMLMPDEVGPEVPAHWGIYFTVDDCAETVKLALELGGQVLRPTKAIEMGLFAVLADPQGAVFQVMDFVPTLTEPLL